MKLSAIMSFILLSVSYICFAQIGVKDTLKTNSKQDGFYQNLENKAAQKRVTRLLYDFLVSTPGPVIDQKTISLEYYGEFEGKLISEIRIQALEVFGPSFQDTSRRARGWLEKTANKVHTNSNIKSLRKLLLFDVGDFVDAALLYENERIIRTLPYIQDVRFIIEQDQEYEGLVKITALTKDRFSFGVTGSVEGSSAASFEVYNQNVFGVGHQISIRFLGSLDIEPYIGLETHYSVTNIKGKFLDISGGYLNSYRNEGFEFRLNRPFITPTIKWGYGLYFSRLTRTDQLFEYEPVDTTYSLNLSYIHVWGGRRLFFNKEKNRQFNAALGIINQNYFKIPKERTSENYYSNQTQYLASLTLSKRNFIQDNLVYSYGITEDIPKGYKYELVYGYSADALGDTHYGHIFFSNGNLLNYKYGYLYAAGGFGGYYNGSYFRQGEFNGTLNYISHQIPVGTKQMRLFSRIDYTLGVRRSEIEYLDLQRQNHIRGFVNRKEAWGKQRLGLNLEAVMFLPKEFYKFRSAMFGFIDLGFIGSSKAPILKENFYNGLGLGLRIHNENLVFKTIQIRLAFYPSRPEDMSLVGMLVSEQSKRNFYSFEPTAPHPFIFE